MRTHGRTRIQRALGVALAVLLTAASSAGQELAFKTGGTHPVGTNAEIDLPEGYAFLDAAGTKEFMRMNQNPVSDADVATVISQNNPDAPWFMVFEWDPVGYVKDDEAETLDADAILESIREGTEASNAERKEQGWPAMHVVGWQEKPRYDPKTNNLTWAIIGESEGGRSVNRNTRLLGRYGVMSAVLVCDPEQLATASAEADQLLQGFRYRSGSRYAEFLPGTDKVAEYGLAALVAGGAGAALVKSGLLAKFWKPIAAAGIAALAGLRRLFGRKSSTPA